MPARLDAARRAPSRARFRRTRSWPIGQRLALGAGFQVAGVPAGVDVATAAIELEDPGGHPVEHVAIVGHQHEPATVHREALLEPGDGVDVEVVRRLVEDQQHVIAGLTRWSHLDEGAGEGDPLGLPARQRGGRFVEAAAEAEPVEDRRGVPRPAGDVTDGVARQWRVLVEHHDPCAAAPSDDPGLGLGATGELPQQRGLPAPVEADDARGGHRIRS